MEGTDRMTDHIEAVDRRTGEAVTITGIHPMADLFPRLEGEDFHDLVSSLREQGLLEPIVIDEQGHVLDGRNRLRACQEAGVKPEVVPYEGDDPSRYALTVNITRRHLTAGQRAMIQAKSRLFATNNLVQEDAAVFGGVSQSRIAYAEIVLTHAPDLVDGVIIGGTSLDEAYDLAKKRRAEAIARASKLERLANGATDLHQLVLEERMSLDEAIAVLDARVAKAEAADKKAEQTARNRIEEAQSAVGDLTATEETVATIGIGLVAIQENPTLADKMLGRSDDGQRKSLIRRTDVQKARRALTELEKML